jgi:V8-like Glu-specific endopeptidase
MKQVLTKIPAACTLLFLAACPAVHAQAGAVTDGAALDVRAAMDYWTPERFASAKPLPLPEANIAPASRGKDARGARPVGQPVSSDAQAPSQEPVPAFERLYEPRQGAENPLGNAIEPQDRGTFNAYFTSTRVSPLFNETAPPYYSADRSYPYRTVGKLFFSIGNANYVCSASIIQRRIVVTAGHCVHPGNPTGAYFSNFLFVPTFRSGVAPFLRWAPTLVRTTPSWINGGGGVPNAADYAMMVIADQPIPPSTTPVRIGNYLGWLGWQTQSLYPNHTSKLGYPCNLDNCQIMQNITSESSRVVQANNVEYGSDAGGGSSGGPWVQNFGVTAAGGGTGPAAASNRVVGITSWGYTSASPKVQGASTPGAEWVNLWNQVCAANAGNCTP